MSTYVWYLLKYFWIKDNKKGFSISISIPSPGGQDPEWSLHFRATPQLCVAVRKRYVSRSIAKEGSVISLVKLLAQVVHKCLMSMEGIEMDIEW